ncbi:LemA family protein [Hoeflea sp. G2-23]|uniref:LemA family protein n=1 Tax=Hoeflea algicola TaxID=2983763 RepID=A0ABT3ZFC7_9HYPH|nr:LemA family protein [Hoeflea algicola]MCY0150489.1 LemA family protein [Hoeflea algicola]
MMTWIILAVLVGIVVYGVSLYNTLVKNRQMAGEGWSGIDVQLKRRADLIPNLLEAVKGYMSHEKELLEEVTRLRSQAVAGNTGSPEQRASIEGALSGALGRLMAVAESYPDLKASENFKEFQQALEETENEISMSRRYYNGAVRNLNVSVETFPSVLIANQFGFVKAEYFEIEEEADRAVPKVSFQ